MDNNVTIYGTKFNLADYEDISQLHELQAKDVFPKFKGVQKAEAETELFNRVYAWNNDVDGLKSEVKVMTKMDVVVPSEPVPPAKPAK